MPSTWMCGGEVVAIHSVTKRVQTPDINFISTLMEFDNAHRRHAQ